MDDPERHITDYQKTLFELLSEFFMRATGSDAQSFAALETFGDAVRRKASALAPRSENAFRWLDDELRPFYAREGRDAFRAAQTLGGLKLSLGGQSYFGQSQLNSVTSSLLYADTVLIPDPVLPWLESARREERFRLVKLLEATFVMLHLRPLVDANLPFPACMVFPSWEKSLEDKDPSTWQSSTQLVADLIAHFVDPSLKSYDDVIDFVDSDPDAFFERAQQHSLFLSPGGKTGEALESSLQQYEKYIETWRSEEWLEEFRTMSSARKVLCGISERVQPQFHVLENSQEMHSHPLFALEQHAHYFKLLSNVNSARLNRLGFLDKRRQALVDGFGTRRLRWLTNVPLGALVELRRNNENEKFRKRVEAVVRTMHESAIADSDRVAAELCRELSGVIADHDREMRDIQSRYNWIHGKTAVAGWAGLGAQLIPSLAPFVGPIALPTATGVMAKYAWDKSKEIAEKRRLSRSLLGVLATARRKDM